MIRTVFQCDCWQSGWRIYIICYKHKAALGLYCFPKAVPGKLRFDNCPSVRVLCSACPPPHMYRNVFIEMLICIFTRRGEPSVYDGLSLIFFWLPPLPKVIMGCNYIANILVLGFGKQAVRWGPFIQLRMYSQTPLIRPSLVRLNGSPAKNGLEQIFSY